MKSLVLFQVVSTWAGLKFRDLAARNAELEARNSVLHGVCIDLQHQVQAIREGGAVPKGVITPEEAAAVLNQGLPTSRGRRRSLEEAPKSDKAPKGRHRGRSNSADVDVEVPLESL